MTKDKDKKVTLTKEQILALAKGLTPSNLHPTAEQRLGIKHVTKEEFVRYAKKCGTGGHIGVSKHWVDKLVRVTIEEVPEE
jgi:hypothetical protein